MPLQSTIGHQLTSHIPHPAGWPERWARLLAATVFRPVCCLCDAPGHSPWLDLCEPCAAALPALPDVCTRCAGPIAEAGASSRVGSGAPAHAWAQLCRACRLRAPACDLAVVPFVYEYPVDRLIRGLKFDGERVYGRVLGAFMQQYPQITAEVEITSRHVDPLEEGVDIAILIGQPQDSTLIARKLFSSGRRLCASPVYLAANGTPQTVADLANHRAILLPQDSTRYWHE